MRGDAAKPNYTLALNLGAHAFFFSGWVELKGRTSRGLNKPWVDPQIGLSFSIILISWHFNLLLWIETIKASTSTMLDSSAQVRSSHRNTAKYNAILGVWYQLNHSN